MISLCLYVVLIASLGYGHQVRGGSGGSGSSTITTTSNLTATTTGSSDNTSDNNSSNNQYIKFLVFGDWGLPGKPQRKVAEQMGKMNDLDFIISVGDNFYPHGVASTSDKQWKDTFKNIYDYD